MKPRCAAGRSRLGAVEVMLGGWHQPWQGHGGHRHQAKTIRSCQAKDLAYKSWKLWWFCTRCPGRSALPPRWAASPWEVLGKKGTAPRAKLPEPGFLHHSQTPLLGLELEGTDRPLLPSHGSWDGLVTPFLPVKACLQCRRSHGSPWELSVGGRSLAEDRSESRMGPPMLLEVPWISPAPP